MMNTINLKEYIISKIKLSSDEDFLNKIKEVIDIEINVTYSLSNEQIRLVCESETQYKNGNFIEQNEMNNRVNKWISEK